MKNKLVNNNDSDQNLKRALMKILLDLNVDLPDNEYTHAILTHIVEEADKTIGTSKSINKNQTE